MRDGELHVTAKLPLSTWQKEISNSQRKLHTSSCYVCLPGVPMPFQVLTNIMISSAAETDAFLLYYSPKKCY